MKKPITSGIIDLKVIRTKAGLDKNDRKYYSVQVVDANSDAKTSDWSVYVAIDSEMASLIPQEVKDKLTDFESKPFDKTSYPFGRGQLVTLNFAAAQNPNGFWQETQNIVVFEGEDVEKRAANAVRRIYTQAINFNKLDLDNIDYRKYYYVPATPAELEAALLGEQDKLDL